jgi:hypothetical protein
MVRPTALAVALADGLAGTALAAWTHTVSDVVRYEIEASRALSVVTYDDIGDFMHEGPARSTSSREPTNVAGASPTRVIAWPVSPTGEWTKHP